MKIYALPGFLGEAADWEEFHHAIVPCCIKEDGLPWPEQGFEAWAANFNAKMQKRTEVMLLMGYSLGGRLALHCLKDSPGLWDGVIFISTHLGLPLEARSNRMKQDEAWAQRFEKEDWEGLMAFWNSQEVFAGFPNPFKRPERDRDFHAAILRHWSLGKQAHFGDFVAQLDMPILWIAGERDPSAHLQAKHLQFKHPKSQVWIAPNAGHRVPWERKKDLHNN